MLVKSTSLNPDFKNFDLFHKVEDSNVLGAYSSISYAITLKPQISSEGYKDVLPPDGFVGRYFYVRSKDIWADYDSFVGVSM